MIRETPEGPIITIEGQGMPAKDIPQAPWSEDGFDLVIDIL